MSPKYAEDAFFRPYFPSCSLAVRRADLRRVGGFRERRSGADADLCWRVLDRPWRTMATVPEVLMDWVPRASVGGYLAQSFRYGRAHHRLRREWARAGAAQKRPLSHRLLARRTVGALLRGGVAAARRRPEDVAVQLRKGARVAHELGVRTAVELERSRPGRPDADTGSARLSIVFLDQGRATERAAMGIAGRVRRSLEAGLQADRSGTVVEYLSVPASPRLARLATRPMSALGLANLWSVRFALTRSWLARRLLLERLSDHQPDIVHITTDQVALLLGRIRRHVPCVLSLDCRYVEWNRMTHGIADDRPTPWHLRPNEWLEARALSRPPLVVAWTETVARDVRAAIPGASVVTLHPGLDLEAFKPPRSRSGGPRPRVLFVGGRWEAKGGPSLVEALGPRLGADVELDAVTPGRPAVCDGMRVHSLDPGSGELHDLFARADLFCLPTTVDACPWAVLEAMAYGLPVLSTRIGSIPELLGDGGGSRWRRTTRTPYARPSGASWRTRIAAASWGGPDGSASRLTTTRAATCPRWSSCCAIPL